jgi:vacuolar-type H+-ATPase subunit I/STV1
MKVAIPALLFVALVVGVAWLIGYYFDPTLGDFRDVVVIVYGVMGILLFTVLIAVAAALFFVIRGLSRAAQDLLDEPIRPTLEEVRETARNARAASEFYADHAVNPLIKTVAAVRSVRRGFSSIVRLAGRGRK